MSEEAVHLIALELIPGIGSRGVKQLISYCGSAKAVLTSKKSHLLKIPGVGEKMANTILSSQYLNEAESIIRSADKIEATVLSLHHPDYPKRLRQIPDAPNILYKKGNGDLNPARSIAIVGTRKATAYGKSITDKVVKELEAMEVIVVSGLAYGIDIQAHRACLQHGMSTVAVVAGGLDRLYPSTHKKYADDMLVKGAILTESPPGTKPDPHLFPARNRIIAGIADATIVVEAAIRGGALITAHLADSYDRLVFSVPGDVGNMYSEGTNKLIATQKALIYTGVEDLIYHLNWDTNKQSETRVVPDLEDSEQGIYDVLLKHNAPMEIDLIALKSQVPINQVASILLSLEFKNLVKSLPGKKFTLT